MVLERASSELATECRLQFQDTRLRHKPLQLSKRSRLDFDRSIVTMMEEECKGE